MPRFLALDGDTAHIQVVSGNVKGASVRLEKSAAWDEGQPISAANAEAAGRALRDQLKSAGIATAPLLVCVGRERVVLKEIKVPAVPPHEEPAIVRFQALKELTDADELQIDFTGAPAAKGATDRRVQVLGIRKDLLAAYKKVADTAGLKLVSVTPRPFATFAGLQRAVSAGQVPPPPADGAVGLLVRGEKWGELTVTHGGALMQARSLAGPAMGNETALIGEIRRNLAIHANQNPDLPVKALYIAEPDSPGGLRDRLETALGLPVHAYEPLVGLPATDGPQGGLAGPAGLLALRAAAELPINFVHPRQPRPPRDPAKSMLALAAVVAAVVVLAVGAFGYMQISKKSKEVAALQKEKLQLDETLRGLDPEIKRMKALDEWSSTDVNWLDELYDLTARVSDNSKLQITQISATPYDDPSKKSKRVATVKIKGITTSDPIPLEKLLKEFRSEPSYTAPISGVARNPTYNPRIFPLAFNATLEVEKRPPDKYTREFTIIKAPKKNADNGFEMGGFNE